MLKRTLFIFLLPLLLAVPSYAAQTTLSGKVVEVIDGDTVDIKPEFGKIFRCRIYGIDTPETPKFSKKGKLVKEGQPFGIEAMVVLKEMVLGNDVDVIKLGYKTYKRDVCVILRNKTDIGREMVKKGYAWAYRQYLRRAHASEYISLESEARAKHLGLWQDLNPTPPWEFRKAHRGQRSKSR